MEFLEQIPQLDAILVPTSGGGMVAGIAVAAKSIKPDIRGRVVSNNITALNVSMGFCKLSSKSCSI